MCLLHSNRNSSSTLVWIILLSIVLSCNCKLTENVSHGEKIENQTDRCKYYLSMIQYEHQESSVKHICELNNGEIVTIHGINTISNRLKSGESIIIFPKEYINEESDTLDILDESLLKIETITRISAERTKGTKKVLAIRANALDTSTSMSVRQMKKRIFGNKMNISLRNQYKKCSFNQFILQPFNGVTKTGETVVGGVGEVDININVNGASQNSVDGAMAKAAALKYGKLEEQFDLVIFCTPPKTGTWLAYALMNGWKSVYNDLWCNNLSTLQHEVGHNINLGHSGEGNFKYGYYMYGDESCPMGFGSYNTHLVKDGRIRPRCFNGAKSWQLGWYSKGHVTINPSNPTFEGKLIGVVNYNKLNKDKVLVRIQGSDRDYYIAFNHKAKFNSLPLEGANQVMITSKKGLPSNSAGSNLESRLSAGDSYTVEGTYKVTVLRITNSSRAYAKIKIEVDNCSSNSECTDNNDNCIVGTCNNQGFCNRKLKCDQCGKTPVLVEIVTDNSPDKTSWNIVDSSNVKVEESDPFVYKFAMYNKEMCLGSGDYTFIMNKPGEEICCPNTREGYFALSVDGNLLKQDILSNDSKYEGDFSI